MKIGIMQPYFFPYIGYFSLINYVDRFVFFDTPQYINKGWVNRNRILKQDKKIGYITVPVKKMPRNTSIKDILITENVDWKNKIYGQLTVYKRIAPNYEDVICLLHNILDRKYNRLSSLNIETIKEVCEYLEIEKKFDIFSQMNLEITNINSPDEWALNITKMLKGDIYVNLPGGQLFIDRDKYKKETIKLEFLKSNLPRYIQRIGFFYSGLSIIDVLMFCYSKEIKEMLKDFIII